MKVFRLPDLGEGLPDAVIREWHVAEGDRVSEDQSLVTVETAKALVEVPTPWSGTVEKLFAAIGDTVETGQPLAGFIERATARLQESPQNQEVRRESADSATVVGKIEQSERTLAAQPKPVGRQRRNATPAVRALARRLRVDLNQLEPAAQRFTAAEVRAAAVSIPAAANSAATIPAVAANPATPSTTDTPSTGPAAQNKTEPARRAMALAMSRARDQVAPMTLCDEVDISAWWGQASATLRLIRAVQAAVRQQPNLNATYQQDRLIAEDTLNIGLAVDSPRGLYVPVLQQVATHSDDDLLAQIESFKQQARGAGIKQQDLRGATILLSNFGALAGRFATPVVMPPTVAIVAAGRTYDGVIAVDGQPAVRALMPLSVSADHRAVTGGELARFLKVLMQSLA